MPETPRNGGEAAENDDREPREVHAPVRAEPRILLTPFHNMALMSPATTAEDVDRHTQVFDEMCAELVA